MKYCWTFDIAVPIGEVESLWEKGQGFRMRVTKRKQSSDKARTFLLFSVLILSVVFVYDGVE